MQNIHCHGGMCEEVDNLGLALEGLQGNSDEIELRLIEHGL